MTSPQLPSASADVGVIIVAAGSGTRSGSDELKQFRWVAGKPMLLHSLQTFMERQDVVSVVCVLPRSHAADPPPWIFQCDVERLLISLGGATRMDSVYEGLQDLPDEARTVLIHDAARPFVDHPTIDRVLDAARSGRCATAALPVVDTIKEVGDERRITRTVDRNLLWRAQTPQGFPRQVIWDAHVEARSSGWAATDDAEMCERLGVEVVVVHGSERALKITCEADFAIAEAVAGLR
jgi:2-C-methyl-D-erythritol 4-phosphate cytidylyltransferase